LASTTGEAAGEDADEAADWDDGDEADWLLPQALSAPGINMSATGMSMWWRAKSNLQWLRDRRYSEIRPGVTLPWEARVNEGLKHCLYVQSAYAKNQARLITDLAQVVKSRPDGFR
jgi:hypothetical protein